MVIEVTVVEVILVFFAGVMVGMGGMFIYGTHLLRLQKKERDKLRAQIAKELAEDDPFGGFTWDT